MGNEVMGLKDKIDLTLLSLWAVSAVWCVAAVLFFFDLWWLALPAVPSFCSQLLLCRLTGRPWLRALPSVVCAGVLIAAGACALYGGRWGGLAGLLLAFAGAAALTGVVFGWIAYLPRSPKNEKKSDG